MVVFILGIIIGGTLISAYSGKDLDRLILENNEFKTTIDEQKNQLEQLNQKYKNFLLIQTITPHLDTDINKHTQQEIIKKIRDLLAGLVGKELNEIDPLLLRDIINGASIIVEDQTYQLHLLYIVVSDELELYLKVDKYKSNTSKEEVALKKMPSSILNVRLGPILAIRRLASQW